MFVFFNFIDDLRFPILCSTNSDLNFHKGEQISLDIGIEIASGPNDSLLFGPVINATQKTIEKGCSLNIPAGSYVGCSERLKSFSVFSFKHELNEENIEFIKYLKYSIFVRSEFLTEWDLQIVATSETAAHVLKKCYKDEKYIRKELLLVPCENKHIQKCCICYLEIIGVSLSLGAMTVEETEQKNVHVSCMSKKFDTSYIKKKKVKYDNQLYTFDGATYTTNFETHFISYFDSKEFPSLVFSLLKMISPTLYLDKLLEAAIVFPYANEVLPKVNTVILPVVVSKFWCICQLDVKSNNITMFCLESDEKNLKEKANEYLKRAYGPNFSTQGKMNIQILQPTWKNNQAAVACTYAILTIMQQKRPLGTGNSSSPTFSPLHKSAEIAKFILNFDD
jgi:hypothetical protein